MRLLSLSRSSTVLGESGGGVSVAFGVVVHGGCSTVTLASLAGFSGVESGVEVTGMSSSSSVEAKLSSTGRSWVTNSGVISA